MENQYYEFTIQSRVEPIGHSARLGLIWVAGNLVKGNKPFCIENQKIKKLKKSGKIYLKKTDFFQNAKFVSGLPNGYFPFEKKKFFCMSLFSAVVTAFFAF